MGKVYVGIDLGSTSCAAAVRDPRGNILEECEFPTQETAFIEFVNAVEGDINILLEEGELAGWVYRLLLPHTMSVTVSDPKWNNWVYKVKPKGDMVDARKLSQLLMAGNYWVVYHPKSQEMANFKVVVKHHQQLVKTTTMIRNQIKARLRQQGVIIKSSGVYGSRGRWRVINMFEGTPIAEILKQDFRLLDSAQRERSAAESLITRISRDFPVIARLKMIPGVGTILAARFVAYVQDPNRFGRNSLNRYSCLAVVDSVTGGRPIGRKHLNRDGNGTLKDVSRKTFDGAMRTKRQNGIKEYYYRSLQRSGDKDNARLNTQRKILAIMRAIWRDKTEYSDELVTGKGA